MRLSTARVMATHLSAGVAFAAMAQGGTYPLLVVVLVLALLVVGWVKGDKTPPWLRYLLVVLTAGIGLTLIFLVLRFGLDGVVASGGFCAALSLNRVLSRTGPADDPAIYLTSFLMLTVGAALTGEVMYGVWFVAFAIALTIGLTLSYLDREADQAKLSAGARQELLATPLLRWLLLLSGASLAMALTFFVLFPRVNGRWLGRHGGINPEPLVGFSSTVELGGQGVLRDDPRPALRIRRPNLPATENAPPPKLPARLGLLFRGEALDTFDGRRWSVAPQERHYLRNTAPDGFKGAVNEIEVLPVAGAALVFSPGIAVAARVASWTPGMPIHTQSRAGGDVTIDPHPTGAYHYQVWSQPEPTAAALLERGTDYPDDVRARDLQLPEQLDPRVRALAKTWTKGLQDPAKQAAAIRDHLRQDFTYTVELPGEVPDPLGHFLFERKAGHCEYFSTAMAILLRTLGVPTREVTGFSGAVLAPGGDYYLSRAGDAHSWVEVYFPGIGYAPLDPTPPSYLESEPNSVRAYVAAALDVLDRRWQSAVVDYNLSSQFALLSQASAAMKSMLARFERTPGRHGELPWRAAFGVTALGLTIWLWRRRSPSRRRRSEDAAGEASQAYQAMLKALRSRGLDRRATETPREFAQRVSTLRRAEADHLWELTRLHEQARYRAQTWSLAETERARQLVRTLPRHANAAS